ncbi:hypothetical protein [Sinorhizobium meliloti]|uniref:hypothetical protein n=1 Tax=Rhizobium meliloti TaxID=382 RepID=UPI0018659A9B|nr:hypothetical protein [Sinorhizobium meliloti]
MYFHVSDKDWQAGDVIHPGNYGRSIIENSQPSIIVNVAGLQISPLVRNLMWESALEASRIAWVPGAPSRASVVFLSETLALARRFRDKFKDDHKIFRVAPVDDNANRHQGDFAIFEDIPEPLFAQLAERCRLYLVNPDPQLPEILWEGAVQVEGDVE